MNSLYTVGKVDIIATVSGDGSSSLANALRLAIARCLASMLPIDQGKNRLLVTGLLSQDNRFAERKQPGQRKARKKPICCNLNAKYKNIDACAKIMMCKEKNYDDSKTIKLTHEANDC
ncbi:mitochondrial ribosomal protein S9, putative [Schistosoma mansoni]|uniref:mitochondrial ribosomal protein S9, putative n=1 Tax=Schistosoma mansoni TaxID=6183 RepID=UPI00022C85EB|nr:mitochondrial ribosomal protein S9, putative [Schistosoma mansoni]|eukprot:XP_018644314.1 mitochondrial ribosomal protein S9, putative [Schistosoma mansoni]